MKSRLTFAALALTLAVGACDRDAPTSPAAPDNTGPSAVQAPVATGPLTYTFTNFVVTNASNVTGVFNGVLTITSFSTNAAGDLLANGTLVGQTIIGGVTTAVNETVTGILVQPANQRCTILHLDVGPIFLDLLGLQVSTNRIILDITAQAGPGNLLGNLLCALVHLLDQNPLAALVGNLLNQINAILAG